MDLSNLNPINPNQQATQPAQPDHTALQPAAGNLPAHNGMPVLGDLSLLLPPEEKSPWLPALKLSWPVQGMEKLYYWYIGMAENQIEWLEQPFKITYLWGRNAARELITDPETGKKTYNFAYENGKTHPRYVEFMNRSKAQDTTISAGLSTVVGVFIQDKCILAELTLFGTMLKAMWMPLNDSSVAKNQVVSFITADFTGLMTKSPKRGNLFADNKKMKNLYAIESLTSDEGVLLKGAINAVKPEIDHWSKR